jgi:5-amino-6-(5-phosphoribosylamino)uracil reductase
VTKRPYVVLSCAISVDGCLDAPGPQRLILSGPADLDRVDEERAQADAIMVGAGTVRRDDPRLLIRSPERRAARAAAGLPEHPAGVTLTASGDLDPGARFFNGPAGVQRLVYCPAPLAAKLKIMLNDLAQVIPIPPPLGLGAVLTDLARRGVHRLLVEGGAQLGRQFLVDGLVDELELAVAPFFVGAAAAPRFAGPAVYPHGPGRPMRLAGVRRLDDIVLLKYLLGEGDGADANGGEGARREGAGPRGRGAGAGAERGGRDKQSTGAGGGGRGAQGAGEDRAQGAGRSRVRTGLSAAMVVRCSQVPGLVWFHDLRGACCADAHHRRARP